MIIGIPKETLNEEKRVALAPSGVEALVKSGHSVYIESDAGLLSHFNDEQYREIGANVVYNADEVYQRSEMIAKVARLTEAEAEMLHEEQILFSFLQLSTGEKKIIDKLLSQKVTAISYELIQSNNYLPILQSMSEIAGQLAVQIGERYLQSDNQNSRGILMGGITGVAPAAVVILGAGVVGTTAAKFAMARGAQVIVLDKDLNRLRKLRQSCGRSVTTVLASRETIARGVKFADIFIGAVHIRGEKAPHLVTEEMVKTMKKGSVIVDVSVDQGGCVETVHPTTISDPIYIKHDIIHYCVPNIPALVSRTASFGLTNAVSEYLLQIADNGLANALMGDQGLANGVCTYNGTCSNEILAETFNLEYRRLRVFSTN